MQQPKHRYGIMALHDISRMNMFTSVRLFDDEYY